MRTPRLLLTIALTSLLTVGCAEEEPTPRIAPPATTTATPTASPTPAQETPEEFIHRWAEAEKTMQNTGETAPYLSLTQNCDACQALADTVEQYYGAGGMIEWGGWEIVEIAPWPDADNAYTVLVNSRPTRYRESRTAPISKMAGGRDKNLLFLLKVDGEWRVTESARTPL